jgi:predicted RNase H-like nuclease
MPTFAGLDLAWHGSAKPSGLAVMEGGVRGVALREMRGGIGTDDDILHRLNSLPSTDVVLAIDAPLIIQNATGQRPCETQIGRLYGHANASAHTCNLRLFPAARSVNLAMRLEKWGWVHNVTSTQDEQRPGKWFFEVYPHPAHVVLFDLLTIIRYKKGRLSERRKGLAAFRRTIAEKLSLATPPLLPSPELSRMGAIDLDAMSGVELKSFEDSVDAVLCAYLAAYFWAWGSQRNALIGSMNTGYMVVPTVTAAGTLWTHRRTSNGQDRQPLAKPRPYSRSQKSHSVKSNDLPSLIPERVAWIRAAVSSIPMVGSALDHLLFDKADAIRLRNIETALAAISERIQTFDQDKIDRSWFGSEEALAAFKVMADSVSYEPEKAKIEDMGKIVAACGEQEHAADGKKLSAVEHLSRLSHLQIKLLSAIASTPMLERKVATGDLVQTATAIWVSDIVATVKSGPRFWTGTMKLDEELEVLESYNTIRRLQLMGPSDAAYVLTAIGRHAALYVRTAGV